MSATAAMNAPRATASASVAPPPADGVRAATCRVCGQAGEHDRYDAVERMFGTLEPFAYVRCAACGTLQIAEIPGDLARHYPPNYYSVAREPGAPDRGLKAIARRWRDAHLLGEGGGPLGAHLARRWPFPELAALGRVPGLTRAARILDVGTGRGLFPWLLRERGFVHAQGIEPYVERDLDYPNGLRVRRGTLADEAGTWDVITMHHVFEHVADPAGTLRDAARVLAPGGWLIVRIPVVPSVAWAEYGSCWVALDAPRHLHLFAVDGLRALAAQCGLRLERVDHVASAMQFWGSEQYRQGIALFDARSWAVNPSASPLDPARVAEWERRSVQLNREGAGDAAAFLLRREG